MEKPTKKLPVFEELERIAEIIPYPLYWHDTNFVVLGANKTILDAVGDIHHNAIIGKTPYDFYRPEEAEAIIKNYKEVLATKKVLYHGESIKDITTGETKYFTGMRGPIFDECGNVVGIIGTSIDVTEHKKAEKEAERLRSENEVQKTKIREQEIFRKDVGQLIHDISTPIGTIQMILEIVKANIPESERVALKDAIGSIKGITGNLWSKYKKDEDQNHQPTLISLFISQIVEEKKFQHADTQIEFIYNFNDCHFSFVNVDQLALKRSITNILNNAVDAIDEKGTIHIGLDKKNDLIEITVKDNGKGMSRSVVDKLKNNIAVTSGKKDGHGIGFAQVHETVKNNHGIVDIDSVPNQGTTITISFPEIESPDWLVRELRFNRKDTIVILDDDSSIHGAWDAIFQKYRDVVSIKHFTLGSKAIAFINSFSNKSKVFLLADFELLKQDLSGIDVIKQTNVRSILVTSHYTEKDTLELIKNNNLKVLPKQLASEVTIVIDSSTSKEGTQKDVITKASVVIADDVRTFIDQLAEYISKECKVKVDKYYDSTKLSEELSKCVGTNVFETFYPQNTKFFIDNDFKNTTDGLKLTKALHETGYTKLYLLSGRVFDEGEIPEYLTAILKSDIDKIVKYASESA